MRQNWWKVLCILLLVYTLGMTFYIRLNPGIIAVSETTIQPGYNELTLVGFNTHFVQERETLKIFVRSDSNFICTDIIEVLENDKVTFGFITPSELPSPSIDIFCNNDEDGTLFLGNALFCEGITKGDILTKCEVVVKTDAQTGFGYPFQPRIFESIRNLMLHVPMWFTMFIVLFISFVSSIRYLSNPKKEWDLRAETSVNVGLVFAFLGLITGSIWARFAWGAWWVNDPQLNGALVTTLIYIGYIVLRAGITDDQKQARVAAVFNIFAYVILFILLMILPRFSEGLHPGKGGNPGFNTYDLNSSLRAVFYPAVLGWILLGYWIYHLRLRMNRLRNKLYYDEEL